ncbi:MAG: signal peptidase II [Pseudomonadota bacterium]
MSALFSKARLIGLALAALVAALDQWSKWYVTRGLLIDNIGDNMPLLPFFDLTFTRNYGISLGMFEATSMEMRWILVLLTAGIALAVLVWMMRERVLADIIGLALILGGALGNIYDRVRYGYVIDFADFYVSWIPPQLCPSYNDGLCRPFLIFNIADAAITIGVVVILARALFFGEKDEGNDSETSGEANAALEN